VNFGSGFAKFFIVKFLNFRNLELHHQNLTWLKLRITYIIIY